MNLNQHLHALHQDLVIPPREEALLQTIETAKMAYYRQIPPGTSWDFLWSQFCLIRKRWWAMQAALLALAAMVLPELGRYDQQVRSAGVIGCLFATFLIPELWRNRSGDSTQVEAACLYSLRQIYAARFLLFGIVDVFLLTLFCHELHSQLGISVPDLIGQFLLPVTVTAGICFQALVSRRNFSESICLILSLCWSALWWLLTCSTRLYTSLVPGLWIALFLLALVFLICSIRRTLLTANQYWEVTFS